MKIAALCLVVACAGALKSPKLVFSDEFDELDTFRWQHEVTLGGGGKYVLLGFAWSGA
jgi:hypothetical protein